MRTSCSTGLWSRCCRDKRSAQHLDLSWKQRMLKIVDAGPHTVMEGSFGRKGQTLDESKSWCIAFTKGKAGVHDGQ